MDETGPRSLPIVALTTFLVGLLLAYMGGAQLGRIGAQMFIADLVTVGVVRELAGLMTGVILAGRVGAAFAAQLGTMQANEEIDALRTLGVNPMEYLVLPRLLGMLLVAPLLVAMAMLVGVLAGLPAAVAIYDVPVPLYLQKCLESLTWTHLWIGLAKGTMYTLLVVVAGCREGLHAGRNAQAVGEATTRAVVKALVWIVLAACASTVVLQSLGF
jgi:phospholipid/cholesterol/gamma-HCH transport system permease protein